MFAIPRNIIPWKFQRLFKVCLNRRIDRKTRQIVKDIIANGADDVARSHHVPSQPFVLAILGENVLLGVVEVVFQSNLSSRGIESVWNSIRLKIGKTDSSVKFKGWTSGRTNVKSVMLRTGLK